MLPTDTRPVAIVGAGLAGLTAARHLHRAGVPLVVFEAADRVGGRVATDEVDGFLLDRGFQVFLSEYPDARRELDLDSLDLCAFFAGSLIRFQGRTYRIADAWKHPAAGVRSLFTPIVSPPDAPAMTAIRFSALAQPHDPTSWPGDAEAAGTYLARRLSGRIVERFLRPFFGGVFLDHALSVPRPYFDFVFAMFARGRATLPAKGMASIPRQLAEALPSGSIRLNTRVTGIRGGQIQLADGTQTSATHVVLATDGGSAAALLGSAPTVGYGCVTLYYAASTTPFDEPILMLNGDGVDAGPVNHVCVPSNVAPGYAPSGQALISATVIGTPTLPEDQLELRARAQLTAWFGTGVRDWRFLRSYRIAQALPRMPTLPVRRPELRDTQGSRLIVAGDHVETPSINGAIASGVHAARAVIDDLR